MKYTIILSLLILTGCGISTATAEKDAEGRCEKEGGMWAWGVAKGHTYDSMFGAKAKVYFGMCLPGEMKQK